MLGTHACMVLCSWLCMVAHLAKASPGSTVMVPVQGGGYHKSRAGLRCLCTPDQLGVRRFKLVQARGEAETHGAAASLIGRGIACLTYLSGAKQLIQPATRCMANAGHMYGHVCSKSMLPECLCSSRWQTPRRRSSCLCGTQALTRHPRCSSGWMVR